MTALKQARWDADRFLEWAAGQPGKYELEAGRVIEMAAEQAKHALMKHAAAKALDRGIERAGLACQVFPDGMTVRVDKHHVRLPDAAVQCSPVDPESIELDKPVILVEVISPSSVNRDENYKLVEYFSLPSVSHYLVLSPERQLVVHFRRVGEGIETTFRSEGEIELTPPGLTVSVAELLGNPGRNAAQRN